MQTEQMLVNMCALRPYTTRELFKLYGVSDKTFRKWLAPFKDEIGEKHGIFFTIKQVKTIFQRLGTPGMSMESLNS